MPDYKGILNSVRHPEGAGTKIKGQIKSLVGRGEEERRDTNHVAQPLSSLRDPASFGPPPKHISAGGPVAVHQPQPEPEAPPPRPYHVDTTGLSTSHLPPPPGRKDGVGPALASLPPPPPSRPGGGPPSLPPRLPPRPSTASASASSLPPPGLPARVSMPPSSSTSAQNNNNNSSSNSSGGLLNQGAISRLGAAGISVPGLGIGNSAAPPPQPPRRNAATPPSATQSSSSSIPQLDGLRSKFARLGTTTTTSSSSSSTSPLPSPGANSGSGSGSTGGGGGGGGIWSGIGGGSGRTNSPPTQGTTLAQKQAAIKTAAALRKDPSSVSISDARAAASTLNNFRQRHSEQVAAGLRGARDLNEKYGGVVGGTVGAGTEPASVVLGKKKPAPPPPPPKKKPGLGGGSFSQARGAADDGSGEASPPPVPVATKPQF